MNEIKWKEARFRLLKDGKIVGYLSVSTCVRMSYGEGMHVAVEWIHWNAIEQGIEIVGTWYYEGDIIECMGHRQVLSGMENLIKAKEMLLRNHDNASFDEHVDVYAEILGNIHDDPELEVK